MGRKIYDMKLIELAFNDIPAGLVGPYDRNTILRAMDVPGQPEYRWNGEQWVAQVNATTNPLTGMIEVSGTGAVLTPKVSLSPQLLTDCILGQLPDGRFVGFGLNDSSFDARLWISTAYVGGTITRVNSSATYVAAGGLQDTAGAEIGGANAGIITAFFPSNGDILMVTRAHAAGTQHLFRVKANNASLGANNTIGSDALYSNKKAILDLGRLTQGSGAQTVNIKANYGRAFCEATIAGAKVYLFAEYNVASGRVAGSTNDQAIVWKSTDAGATWSILLEFNTDGSTHQIDHFHGVVQDPYSGWIYFMTGDNGAECALIAWDGVSAAPAANSSLATIKATAGWKAISGSELNRYTDLCFGPAGLYSIPDCDSEAADATSIGFVGTSIPRTLDYVASIAPVARASDLPPVMAARHVSGWAAMVSFRTAGAAESYLHLWLQDDPNGLLPWRLANKIRNYLSTTAVPSHFFFGSDGALYLSGKYGASIQFSSAANSGTTIRFSIGEYTAGVNVFDGA